MKSVILYESFFGNTKTIAEDIFKNLKEEMEIQIFNISDFDISKHKAELLIIGCATRQFGMSPATKSFIKNLDKNLCEGLKFAAFDTRINLEKVNSKFWSRIVDKAGYAAPKIEKSLMKKGAQSIIGSKGFLVDDTEGPVSDGEIKNIKVWTDEIKKAAL